jgi:hypothetical protein
MGHKPRKRPQCNLSPDDPGWVLITDNHDLLKVLMQRAGNATLVANTFDEEARSNRMPLLIQSKRGGPRQRIAKEFWNEAQIGTMHVNAPYRFNDDQPQVLVLGLRPRPLPDEIQARRLEMLRTFGLTGQVDSTPPRDQEVSRPGGEQSSHARNRTITWSAMGRLFVFAPQSYLDWLFPTPFAQSDVTPRRPRTRTSSGSNELTDEQIKNATKFAETTYDSDPKRYKHRTTLAEYVTTEHLNLPKNKCQTVDRHVTKPLFQKRGLLRKSTRSSARK